MRKNWRVAAVLAGRFAPAVPCAAGGLLLLYAAAAGSGATLPYPDPTPELLAEQRREILDAQIDACVGAGLLLAGGAWWALLRPWSRGRRQPTGTDGRGRR